MKKILLSLTVLTMSLFSEGIEDKTKLANRYFAAEKYSEAKALYEEILSIDAKGLQKGILHYNLGTCYLKEAKFSLASNQFSKITSSDVQYPNYLLERAYYNIILSCLKNASSCLEDSIVESSQLHQASESLNESLSYIERYTQHKEYYESKSNESKELLQELKNSYKELKSLYRIKLQEKKLSELNMSQGFLELSKQKSEQLYNLEVLGREQKHPSYYKYYLSCQHTSERAITPTWKKVDQLIEDEIKKCTYQMDKHPDLKEQIAQEINQLQVKKRFFTQAYQNRTVALDYLKEGELWKSRLYQAKAKHSLEILEKMDNSEDILEGCLSKRIELAKKKNSDSVLEYQNSVDQEWEHLSSLSHQLAMGYSKKFLAKDSELMLKHLENKKSQKKERAKVITDLFSEFKSTLKRKPENLEDQSEADLYLYHQIYQNVEDTFYGLYEKVNQNNLADQNHFKYSLKSSEKYLKSQLKHLKDGTEYAKASYAFERIPNLHTQLETKKNSELKESLKDVLVQYDFPFFSAKELEKNLNDYSEALKQDQISDDSIQKILEKQNEVLALKDNLQKQDHYQDEVNLIEEDIKKAQENINQIQSNTNLNPDQKKSLLSLSQNGIKDLIDKLKLEEKSSQQMLQNAIERQELAKQMSEQNLDQASQDQAQKQTLDQVGNFEAQCQNEQKQMNQEDQQSKQGALNQFKMGEKEAKEALKGIKQDKDGQEIVSHQGRAIEHWQEALENLGQNQNKSSGSDQNSMSSKSDEPQDEDSQMDQSAMEEKEIDEEELKAEEQSEELNEVLQKLKEMQEQDQGSYDVKPETKKGLRPW